MYYSLNMRFSLKNYTIRVNPEEIFELEVPGSGTTGYLWNLEVDIEKLEIIDHQIIADNTSFGGSGQEIYRLKTLEPGQIELKMILKAPWEPNPAEVHVLNIISGED